MEEQQPDDTTEIKKAAKQMGDIIGGWIGGLSPELTTDEFERLLIDTLKVPDTITGLSIEEMEEKVSQLSPLALEVAHSVIGAVYDDRDAQDKIIEGGEYNRRIGLALVLHYGGIVQLVEGKAEERQQWRYLKQGPLSTALLQVVSKVKEGHDQNTEIDTISGIATTRRNGLMLAISEYEQMGGLKASAHRLFERMMIDWTENRGRLNAHDIDFSLRDYWEEFDLSASGTNRKQVEKDLHILACPMRFNWTGKDGAREQLSLNIFDYTKLENGRVQASLTRTAKALYTGYSIMPHHRDTWKFDLNRNPNSPYFFRRILLHMNMNQGKSNEKRISVKTLLEAAPGLPSYEEVMAKGRQVKQRIIDPTERDLDALKEKGISWTYERPGQNSKRVSRKAAAKLSYAEWEDLIVVIETAEGFDFPYRKKLEIEAAGPEVDRPKKKEVEMSLKGSGNEPKRKWK